MLFGLLFTAPPDVCPPLTASKCPCHLNHSLTKTKVNTPPQPCNTTRACRGQTGRAARATRRAARSFGGCGWRPSTTAAPAVQKQERLRRPRRCTDRLAPPTGHQPAGGQPAFRQAALHHPLLPLCCGAGGPGSSSMSDQTRAGV
eukprot:358375-Chlamydomonas_euryale.AAC.14